MLILLSSLLVAVVAGALAWLVANIFSRAAADYQERFRESANRNLAELFLFVDPDSLFLMNVGLIVATFFLVFAIWGNAVIALLLAAALGASPQFLYRYLRTRRHNQVIKQLPDTLASVASSMKAGLSLNQALETTVSVEKGPLIQEFELFQRENRVGVTFADALDNLYKRVPRLEMQLVVSAMKISRETGGNLSETLERIAATLREKAMMEGKINSLTAQGRLQGIVMCALPILLGLVLNQMEPEAMSYLFTEWYGWAVIGLILTLDAIGFFFIRKIVNIDV